MADHDFLGIGIYTVPEAARLTRVSAGRIRRWLRGYAYSYRGVEKASAPVWTPQFPPMDHSLALGFLDLIEVRFVNAFRERGVSWKTIRKAANRAAAMFQTAHPFATQRFRTDGRSIFCELRNTVGEPELLDIARTQLAFLRVLKPYLSGIEYQDDQAIRWWPMGKGRRVVVDPARSFGQPIVEHEGVPTSVLSRAVRRAGNSVEDVAKWYDVRPASVRAAVAFEDKLAA